MSEMNQIEVALLVFGAHADDVELAAAGTIAAAVAQGQKVGIIDLTRGEMGTRGTPEIRARESDRAAEILGVSFRERLDCGDGTLRTGRHEELEVMRKIRASRPSIVIAPWPDDRHPDHTRAGQLITSASFYAGLVKIETGQPPHRPQAVLYYLQNYMQQPSFIVDVSATWEKKIAAIGAYESQFYNPNSAEPETFIARKSFLDAIEARARHFGEMIGVERGEPFVSRQPPRVDDLVAAYRGREVS
jgi:bacillithiol biosynthesis deacetylase BshB1